jgi:hypothetical protein
MTNLKERTSVVVIAWLVWFPTGGLMIVHFISGILGVTSLLLFVLGMFIPPIGLVNAIVILWTGDSLQQFFP